MENRLLRQPVFFVGVDLLIDPRAAGSRPYRVVHHRRWCRGALYMRPGRRLRNDGCHGRIFNPPLQGAVQICRGRCPHRPADGRWPPLQGAVEHCGAPCRGAHCASDAAPASSTKLSTVSTELSTAFVEKSREIPCNGSTVCDIIYIELFCLFPAIAMETP